jgi:hypothetical protein
MKSKSPKQRSVSFKEYILMPSLFFLALLATWVAPTINRVSTFIHPDYQSYSLLLAVSALGSLRGFWNGIIFITVGVKGWRRRSLDRRAVDTKVSEMIPSTHVTKWILTDLSLGGVLNNTVITQANRGLISESPVKLPIRAVTSLDMRIR